MDINYDKLLLDIKILHKNYTDFTNKKRYKDLTEEQFLEQMTNDHGYVKEKFSSIFDKCVTGRMDLNVVTYMIKQAKDIAQNKISNYDASVNVGQKLVDKFIKPGMNKNKDKDDN
jgi:hypothetical protein